MKCRITKMRRDGVALPKYEIKNQLSWLGELLVRDMREDGLNRHIWVARHTYFFGDSKEVFLLYEPQLLWMNEGRFVLSGFERVLDAGKLIDYAQSWLRSVEGNEAPK